MDVDNSNQGANSMYDKETYESINLNTLEVANEYEKVCN